MLENEYNAMRRKDNVESGSLVPDEFFRQSFSDGETTTSIEVQLGSFDGWSIRGMEELKNKCQSWLDARGIGDSGGSFKDQCHASASEAISRRKQK